MSNNYFGEVYPFATESVSGYIDKNNVEGKTICTLGSSLDQAFNFFVAGASKVVVYDINPDVAKYYKLKRIVILSCSKKEEVYDKVIDATSSCSDIIFSKDLHTKNVVTSMNNYLQTDENFNKLKEILINDPDISFVVGNIYNIYEGLRYQKFDFIDLSNALDYLYLCIDRKLLNMVDIDCRRSVSRTMQLNLLLKLIPQLFNLLDEDGLVLLFYFYNFKEYDNIENDAVTSYSQALGNNYSGELRLKDIVKCIGNSDIPCDLSLDVFNSNCINNTNDACVYISKR